MRTAEAWIQVNEAGGIEVKSRGPAFLAPALIGACAYAEHWLIHRVKSAGNVGDTTETSMENSCGETSSSYNQREEVVEKQEAIDLYLDAMSKLQKRINSISQTDEQGTFKVNRDILNNL